MIHNALYKIERAATITARKIKVTVKDKNSGKRKFTVASSNLFDDQYVRVSAIVRSRTPSIFLMFRSEEPYKPFEADHSLLFIES
jgi:hypothetical protein